MVEVFKTNVQERAAATLVAALHWHLPSCRINFDLEDCDRILRVEGKSVLHGAVIELLNTYGYDCCILE